MTLSDNVIIEGLRTPVGKLRGTLAEVDAYRLGSAVMKEVVDRAGINASEIDDVLFGNLIALPGNVARVAALDAGLPETVPAQTVDRQCASGLETMNIASALIEAGAGSLYLTGGTESMTRAPHYLEKSPAAFSAAPPRFLPAQLSPPQTGDPGMVQTAHNIAERYGVSRERQDEFAAASHEKALRAADSGIFDGQTVEIRIPATRKREEIVFSRDESPRPGTAPETLARLRPILSPESTVTAGNSCPMNDGAAALLVCSREYARKNGLAWKAGIRAFATAGCDPHYMGMGPVFAVRKLLERTGLGLRDIDLIELNEAFSAQSLACIDELGISDEQLNPNGGAIALGHPLGATGAILAVKLIHEMQCRKSRYGIVTMCIGGGQGIATLFENNLQ